MLLYRRTHDHELGHLLEELIFGFILFTVGALFALLTKRADRARAALTRTISSTNPLRGLNAYGKITYTAATVVGLVVGAVFILVGMFRLIAEHLI